MSREILGESRLALEPVETNRDLQASQISLQEWFFKQYLNKQQIYCQILIDIKQTSIRADVVLRYLVFFVPSLSLFNLR